MAATAESHTISQLSDGFCGRGGGVFRRLVHDLEIVGSGFAEYGADGGEVGGDEGAFAHPVVVEVAVDGSDVVWEVDVDAGEDHGDKGEEKGVCWCGGSVIVAKVGRTEKRTEDELLSGREHVDGEGDFILVDFQANPAHQLGGDQKQGGHVSQGA